jgi:hypothetical protein
MRYHSGLWIFKWISWQRLKTGGCGGFWREANPVTGVPLTDYFVDVSIISANRRT